MTADAGRGPGGDAAHRGWDEVRAEVAAGSWGRALELLEELGPVPDAHAAEALELRAQACYAAGRFEAAVGAWESRFALAVERAEPADAARAAAMVAMYLLIDSGLMAAVRGWLRRGERVVEGHPPGPAHALFALVRTYERFMCGDLAGAGRQAALAIELGEAHGVLPAVVVGRVAGARLRLLAGDVEGGLEDLDEIAALLMSGEVDPLTTGMMYCELICAAQGLGLHDRAAEWTAVMDRWRPGAALGGISGRCRVHRAELLRLSGPCDEAEAEALGACEELRPWLRREFGWPLVELGNIRLRRDDLEGAEEAYLAAHRHVWTPHPGLALLRLAQGDVAAASALVAEAIAHPFDVPSKERPPHGALRLAPLLDAQAEIAAAAGDAETAGRAARALADIAATYRTPGLEAAASLAGARAALVAGDVPAALSAGVAAVRGWADVGAPFEAAIARLVLAEAQACSGNPEGARLERRAAHAAFVAYGAEGWADRVAQLLGDPVPAPGGPPGPWGPGPGAPGGAPPPRPRAAFRGGGDTRTVRLGDLEVVVRDMKGHRYLARLLADPGRELHVLDLVAGERGGAGPDPGVGLPVLDEQARAAYRRRLAEIEEDLDEAARQHDLGRLELAERDREYLVAELARAVGLGGRAREVGGGAERARTSVTRSIRYALRQLAGQHPTVAGHLDRCVRTGTYCSYQPDPLAPVDWEL